MKYLIIIATIMWGAFFYTNAKAHQEWITKKETQQEIQEQLNDMTLEIITIILENLPSILKSIESDLLKEKERKCWHKFPKNPDCIPEMTPMANEVEKND